jgi:hypothetical protein
VKTLEGLVKVPSAQIIASDKGTIGESMHSTDQAWRGLAWFGLMLGIVGLSDVALVFYPARWGDPGWEFAAIGMALSTFPLLIVGIAAMLAAAVARGKRTTARIVAATSIALALLILGGFGIFQSTIPVALRVAPPELMPGIQKSIVRTAIMSLAFSTMFIGGGVMAIRATRR